MTHVEGRDASREPKSNRPSPVRDYLGLHLTALPLHRVILRSVECRLLSRFRFDRPMLDVGVGDGHFASVLFPDGVDAGIDPSIVSLREARDRSTYRQLYAASACSLPFADGSFASVISNSVLEHIPDVDTALDEIARVLRPGGFFVMTVPGPRFLTYLFWPSLFRRLGLRGAARAYEQWFNKISYCHHLHSPEDWIARLEARGLAVQEWEYYFSSTAHKVFDLCHYVSGHSVLVRKLTGRWILFPNKPGVRMQRAILKPFYDQDIRGEGAYIMFVCTKTANAIPEKALS